jgi:hypothetical protein
MIPKRDPQPSAELCPTPILAGELVAAYIVSHLCSSRDGI